jgi:hypothetical protein
MALITKNRLPSAVATYLFRPDPSQLAVKMEISERQRRAVQLNVSSLTGELLVRIEWLRHQEVASANSGYPALPLEPGRTLSDPIDGSDTPLAS